LDKAIFTQAFLSRHELTGLDINSEKFGWMLQAKDHIGCDGVHPQGWSDDWKAWIKRKEDKGIKITPGMVRGKLAHMMGKYELLTKGIEAVMPYHIWQLGSEGRAAYKAAKQAKATGEMAEKAARKAAREASESTAKGIARRGGKMVPIAGIGLAFGFYAQDVQARGVVCGTVNSGLDAVPYLGAYKIASEIATGKDWIPDRETRAAEARFWQRYHDEVDFWRTVEEESKQDPWGR
jgi:hypothetical protein